MTRLQFQSGPDSPSGLTHTWYVENSGTFLGMVKWYAPWRKYTFQPTSQTVFDNACLTEIVEFLTARTTEHKSQHGDRA